MTLQPQFLPGKPTQGIKEINVFLADKYNVINIKSLPPVGEESKTVYFSRSFGKFGLRNPESAADLK